MNIELKIRFIILDYFPPSIPPHGVFTIFFCFIFVGRVNIAYYNKGEIFPPPE
jgi:hypothetical protein